MHYRFEATEFAFFMLLASLSVALGGGMLWYGLAQGLAMHPLSIGMCALLVISGCATGILTIYIETRE
jgi:hypothetical protein